MTVAKRSVALLVARRRKLLVRLLWVGAAIITCLRIAVMLDNHIQPDGDPHTIGVYFLDLRDTVWTPGHFLLAGGNPYDPDTYLRTYPWALPFAPYAPAWLLLSLVLAPLPFVAAILVYQAIALLVAVRTLTLLLRWAAPTLADLGVPALLIWMNVWYPGRGSLSVQMGSLLAVLGVALVIRQLAPPRAGVADAGPRRGVDRATALGVALTLLKAQFGISVMLLCAASGKVREVFWAVVGVAVASLPVAIMCTVAAGGPLSFLQSVRRDVAYANSPYAPSSLTFPGQRRLDVLGILVRHGLDVAAPWLTIVVTVVALAVTVGIVRLTRDPLLLSTTLSVVTLLGVYHSTYDLLMLVVPVAVGAGMIARGELTNGAERLVFLTQLLVVLHLQTVSKALIPHFDLLGADTANVVLMSIALVAALYRAVSLRVTSRAADRRVASVA